MFFLLAAVSSFGAPVAVAQEAPGTTARSDHIVIHTGSGSFVVDSGTYDQKKIRVYYHKPKNFHKDAPVLMVIPGSGRDGDEYRDAWVKASEKYGVLILSPKYSETFYPGYWSYNLAGMTDKATFNVSFTIDAHSKKWHLDDAMRKLSSKIGVHKMVGRGPGHMLIYKIVALGKAGMISSVDAHAMNVKFNPNSKEWIFSDFDRIFELVKKKLNLQAQTYDMFGHSAGGQILHRLVLFHPNSKADMILAANSGWYTVPTFRQNFPYGLNGTGISERQLKAAFDDNLVLFLGEDDDASATGGEHRQTSEAMRQGAGRFARGKHFFKKAKEESKVLGVDFKWKLVTVPGVGHNFRAMSEAAAKFLYGSDAPN
jgi:hypothetical protein